MRKIATIAALAVLAACAGEPVIADISQDKVQVQANGASPEQIQATATQACGMYNRRAQVLSHRCGDQYCIQKIVLFACVPPQTGALGGSSGGYANSSERVVCSFPGVANPNLAKTEMAASSCLSSGGTIVGTARLADGSGRQYGEADMVTCSMASDGSATTKNRARACIQAGGSIAGPA